MQASAPRLVPIMRSSGNKVITLNVGGRLFYTTRDTLKKHPGVMERLFDAGMAPILTDEQGLPFVRACIMKMPGVQVLNQGWQPQAISSLHVLNVILLDSA